MGSFTKYKRKITTFLKDHQMSPNALALAANLSPSSIYRILDGSIKSPSFAAYERICQAIEKTDPDYYWDVFKS